jgi:hypothetical protein
MLRFFKSFFKKQNEPIVLETVPYKVETPSVPEPAKCGCGRSPTGLCVGLHKLSAADWAAHGDNPNKTAPVIVEAKAQKPAPRKPAPQKPVPQKPAARKPAATAAAPKKPRAKPTNQ